MKKYVGNIFITNLDGKDFANQLNESMTRAVERGKGKMVSFDVHYHPTVSCGLLLFTALVEVYEEAE